MKEMNDRQLTKLSDLKPAPLGDDFGFWFSGFVDGEGCFTVRRPLPRPGRTYTDYECAFSIILRQDDLGILEECIRPRIINTGGMLS